MSGGIRQNDVEFDEWMLEIDHRLSKEGVAVFRRPIRAIGEIARISQLPFSVASSRKSGGEPLSTRVRAWYRRQFGDRVKWTPSIGEMVVEIKDDLWVMRLPVIFGSPTIDEELVQDCIPELPRERWGIVSEEERREIFELLVRGIKAFSILSAISDHHLLRSALGSMEAAVHHLVSRQGEYGQSKWASLQVAEKALKAAIDVSRDEDYPYGHELAVLADEAADIGINGDWGDLFSYIQCGSGYRYNEVSCSRTEALDAHHASLSLLVELGRACDQFTPALEIDVDEGGSGSG